MPALVPGDDQPLRCPRCGGALCATAPGQGGADDFASPVATPETVISYDDWELNEQLRHIERILRAARRQTASNAAAARDLTACDRPHAGPPAWHMALAEQRRKTQQDLPRKRQRRPVTGTLAWTALLLGTMSFVCGGALLAWSLIAERPELWTFGLPLAAIGQIALLIGLVLQIEGLWRDNHEASAKLEHVDQQLQELQTAATLLHTGSQPGGNQFYAHLADGAGPQLLLTDLKSQLDLLAWKITEQER